MKAILRDEREMKDSGIEWVGKIPNCWRTARLKDISEIQTGSTPDKKFQAEYYSREDGVPWIKAENLGMPNPICTTKEYLTKNGCDVGRVFPANTVYVCCIASIGKVGYSTIPCSCNQQINGILFNNKYIDYKFGYYLSIAQEEEYILRASGNVLKILNAQQQSYIPCVIPLLNEQQLIANYLDDRCSKIDAIIAEAKSSIEEYKELKQAVIYEAVTKGLDKNVEMKDSGIEWIGNIPKSWEMKKIKYVADFNPKVTIDYDVNQNVGYVPMDAVKFGYMEPLESAIYKLSTGLTQFQNNDIVMAKVTPCFENGEIAIAENLAQEVGFGSSELFVYRANSINRKFLFYYLQHIGFKEMAASTMTGTGGLKRVSSYFARNAEITYPSVAEQQEIVNYLDKNCEGIDSLITEKQSLIEDLDAYKKSLIYEVVTGKRKVVA